MEWVPARSPRPAPEAPRKLVVVDDALLTPFERGTLRASGGPRAVMTGAVHDAAGDLVAASQRAWDGDRASPAAGDPDRVRVPSGAARLDGTWIYAGHWALHFGHFLLEVLTNLWPDPSEQRAAGTTLAGVVAHRTFRGAVAPPPTGPGPKPMDLRPWQSDLLALAGYGDLEVRTVRHRAARVDRLLVPERPVVHKSWAADAAVAVWGRVAANAGRPGDDRRVWLSRTAFHAATGNERRDRTGVRWDAHLDSVFAWAGFRVVHPELLPIDEQVRLVRGAEVVAGSSGSALHLSAFAAPGTRVLEIGDTRSPTAPMPTQRTIDAACGHLSGFVGYRDAAALEEALATT